MDPDVYLSFEECPLDDVDPSEEGDDSLLADAPWANPKAKPLTARAEKALKASLKTSAVARRRSANPARPVRLVVPHPRDLKFGCSGWDVLALQRALSKAKLRKWGTFTMSYGVGTRAEVKKFQQTHHLHVDGIYGVNTHRKLGKFYDAYGIRLLNKVHILTPAERRKAKLLTAAQVLYNRGQIVHYTQGPERMWIVRNHYNLGQLSTMSQDWEDCSSGVTGCYYVAGLADPNGLGYNGQGYTGSLAEHGRSITAAQATVGCLYLYGSFPYVHVTMNVGTNRAWSQGREYGPDLLSPYYRPIGNVRLYPGLP